MPVVRQISSPFKRCAYSTYGTAMPCRRSINPTTVPTAQQTKQGLHCMHFIALHAVYSIRLALYEQLSSHLSGALPADDTAAAVLVSQCDSPPAAAPKGPAAAKAPSRAPASPKNCPMPPLSSGATFRVGDENTTGSAIAALEPMDGEATAAAAAEDSWPGGAVPFRRLAPHCRLASGRLVPFTIESSR